jgi:predicted nucleic acid-binding protein
MSGYLLDANVIIRFLTQDEPKQSKAAAKLFISARDGDLTLHLEASILAETVYVLESQFYSRTRDEIHDSLVDLMQNPGIETAMRDAAIDALRRFREYPALDFADCWLGALASDMKIPVASFDRDLDKFKDIQRHEAKE